MNDIIIECEILIDAKDEKKHVEILNLLSQFIEIDKDYYKFRENSPRMIIYSSVEESNVKFLVDLIRDINIPTIKLDLYPADDVCLVIKKYGKDIKTDDFKHRSRYSISPELKSIITLYNDIENEIKIEAIKGEINSLLLQLHNEKNKKIKNSIKENLTNMSKRLKVLEG